MYPSITIRNLHLFSNFQTKTTNVCRTRMFVLLDLNVKCNKTNSPVVVIVEMIRVLMGENAIYLTLTTTVQ